MNKTENENDVILKQDRNSKVSVLNPKSMEEIFDLVYQNRRPIVKGMIYAGAYLFVGAPKIGKSYFMMQLAYHVSMGIPLWGYEVKKATVLYLALEDDNRRIQQRLYQMFGVQDVSDNLFFSTEKIALSGQLENEIELFLKEHKETGLIIIDTLQKVRGNGSDTLSYAKDYETVGKLKEIADRNDVCIMVVHHTRKQQSEDAFDMISGTNGLMGAADCSMILHKEKRTSNKAILDITGRDQTDQRIYLKRDEERLIWQFEKSESELWKEKPDPLLEVIVDFIISNDGEWSGTSTELAKILAGDIQPNALSMMLNVRAGKLLEEYQICYEKGRNHRGRYIKLFLCEKKA